MTERIKIAEEDGIHKEWYVAAKNQTLESLPDFLRELTERYEHDYGTICHAIAASAIAAAWAVEKTPQGGITGFQAGAIMWEFIQNWMHMEGPMRLVDYKDLLFPQYADKFGAISHDIWNDVQAKAREKLQSADGAHERVIAHWQSIVDGVVPFGLRIAA